MSIKSKNKRIRICVMGGTIAVVLASLWALLVKPETALAAPPEGKGKGGDKVTTIYFDVLLGVDAEGNNVDVLLGVDELGNPVFGNPDIFMVCGSGIEGRIQSGYGGTNVDRMIVNSPSPLLDITSVIDHIADPDQSCFGGIWDGTGFIGEGTLGIELPDRTVNEVTVSSAFRARDTKGKRITYIIRTTGKLVSGLDLIGDAHLTGDEVDWAAVQDAVNEGTADPGTIPNFFVQVASETDWTLSKYDGNQQFACTGSGSFASGFGISITNPRLEVQNNILNCQ